MLRTFALTTPLMLAALGACIPVDDGDFTVQIEDNKAFEGDGICTITADENAAGRASGLLDIAARGDYTMFPFVRNLAEPGDRELVTQRTYFNTGYRISLSSPDPAVDAAIGDLRNSTVLASFSIEPGGTTVGGTGTLPAGLTERIAGVMNATGRATIIVSMVGFGKFAGQDMETRSIQFPIEMCIGCLVRNIGACSSIPPGFPIAKGSPCALGQDLPLDCCSLPNGGAVCPAVAGN